MLIAATASGYILAESAERFLEARYLSKYLVGRGNQDWMYTWTRTPQERKSKCSPTQLRSFIETGDINGPSISERRLETP